MGDSGKVSIQKERSQPPSQMQVVKSWLDSCCDMAIKQQVGV